MTYTVEYFIKKFEAIPESLWCVNSLLNDKGQRCVLGHCITRDHFKTTSESAALAQLPYAGKSMIHDINNGNCDRYQQATPKQRVLAALYDIKAKEIDIKEAHEVLNSIPVFKP